MMGLLSDHDGTEYSESGTSTKTSLAEGLNRQKDCPLVNGYVDKRTGVLREMDAY